MSFSFVSILTDVKKFFTNPTVEKVGTDVQNVAVPVIEDIFPAATPLINGIIAVVAKVELDAANAKAQTGTGAQKLDNALSLAEGIFEAYETAQKVIIPNASKTGIVNAIVSILNLLPASSAPAAEIAKPAAAKE
jgi:hypothetical protein